MANIANYKNPTVLQFQTINRWCGESLPLHASPFAPGVWERPRLVVIGGVKLLRLRSRVGERDHKTAGTAAGFSLLPCSLSLSRRRESNGVRLSFICALLLIFLSISVQIPFRRFIGSIDPVPSLLANRWTPKSPAISIFSIFIFFFFPPDKLSEGESGCEAVRCDRWWSGWSGAVRGEQFHLGFHEIQKGRWGRRRRQRRAADGRCQLSKEVSVVIARSISPGSCQDLANFCPRLSSVSSSASFLVLNLYFFPSLQVDLVSTIHIADKELVGLT